jgi:hypothetical protein
MRLKPVAAVGPAAARVSPKGVEMRLPLPEAGRARPAHGISTPLTPDTRGRGGGGPTRHAAGHSAAARRSDSPPNP